MRGPAMRKMERPGFYDFTLHWEARCPLDTAQGLREPLASPHFLCSITSLAHVRLLFRLHLVPNDQPLAGAAKGDPGTLGLRLEYVEGPSTELGPFQATFKAAMADCRSKTETATARLELGREWGFDVFLPRSPEELRRLGFLAEWDPTLRLSATLRLPVSVFDLQRLIPPSEPATSLPGLNRRLLAECREGGCGRTDFVLGSEEGGELPCHRAVLAASASGYFAALFGSLQSQEESTGASAQRFSERTLWLVLEAVYTEAVGQPALLKLTTEELWHAAEAARYFQLPPLKHAVHKALVSRIFGMGPEERRGSDVGLARSFGFVALENMLLSSLASFGSHAAFPPELDRRLRRLNAAQEVTPKRVDSGSVM